MRAGDRDLEEALGNGRETGLGLVGPWVLGHLARSALILEKSAPISRRARGLSPRDASPITTGASIGTRSMSPLSGLQLE
jgi:hypothetical protein